MVNVGKKDKLKNAKPDEELPSALPKPSSRRGNVYKLATFALLVATGTAGVLLWLSQDEKTRDTITDTAQTEVASALQDTVFEKPFQLAVDYLLPPAPLPSVVTQPPTAPGTLAGQEIRTAMGPVPSTQDEGDVTENANAQKSSQNGEETLTHEQTQGAESPHIITPMMPKVKEDTMVPLPFVEDVAQWMVTHYTPSKGMSFNLSAINLRYGQQMYALMPSAGAGGGTGDVYSARMALLRYAFNAPMLTALYDLYAERFVETLALAAAAPTEGKALTQAQTSEMYTTYAHAMTALSGVFDGIGNLSDFDTRMRRAESLSQESLDVHSQLTDAVFDLDTAREQGDEAAQKVAQTRIDDLNEAYQDTLANRRTAREDLVKAIYGGDELAQAVDADTVLFVAEWLDRRGGESGESSLAVARILRDMAGRLQKAAGPVAP